jgi:hypothetical protein
MTYVMQALDIYGARSRNRTGTPLRAGDFKSRARIKRAAAWMRFFGPQFDSRDCHSAHCFRIPQNDCGPKKYLKFHVKIEMLSGTEKLALCRLCIIQRFALLRRSADIESPCYSGFVQGGNQCQTLICSLPYCSKSTKTSSPLRPPSWSFLTRLRRAARLTSPTTSEAPWIPSTRTKSSSR